MLGEDRRIYTNLLYFFKVKLTVVQAHEFRTKGAALARAKTEGFQGLYFGQCTTLSTRVRMEVGTIIRLRSVFERHKFLLYYFRF